MEDLRTPASGNELEDLEKTLKVLAYLNRLQLLGILRTPHTLDEIRLTPGAMRAGDRPGRILARESVREHLDQLVRATIVRVRATNRKGKRPVYEYVVDHGRLFAIAEEFRKLAALAPLVKLEPFRTQFLRDGSQEAWEDGPKLVLVHGAKEGIAFQLRATAVRPGRGWIIGRDATTQACLEYDPYVSHEHAEILRTKDGFRLLDLRTARNGTYLNWHRIPVGGDVALRSADVIGVGRSLLVFRET